MNIKAAILLFIFGCFSSRGEFGWPDGVSNKGPYTLVSVVSNITVFMPNSSAATENDPSSHKYNHHTRIFWSSNMAWIAFSSAATNETDSGMQTVACYSTNRGMTWSAPIQIVPSQSGFDYSYSNTILGSQVSYPRNFQQYNGSIYLVGAVDSYCDTNQKCIGRGLLARQLYSDGTVGSLFAVTTNYFAVDGRTTPDYNATLGPPLLEYSKVYGCWGGSRNDTNQSEWLGWITTNGPNGYAWTEPNAFSKDGTAVNLYRLWRTIDWHVAYYDYSTNSGASWSLVLPTSIPSQPSEQCGTRLSDGRYVIIGNPVNGGVGCGESRDPLFLAITSSTSSDVTNVYAIRQGVAALPVYEGCAKRGGCAYPGVVQVGNYLYVSYSIHKESIGFSRVLIPGLDDNDNDGPIPKTSLSINATTANVGSINSP